RALYRRSLEYGLGITAVSKVFYSVANFIYLAISVCECQFNDLVRKYDKNFYKDKSLMEDNEKARKFEKIAYQIVEDCEKRLEK
ncbi:hypothetical protein ACG9X2_09955, partial [Acinetobacter bereziniae]|uniref:hypothetical protein n=1 Tax=Acinetobacter bereziniae TaxID=106648 RepID=UPI003AF63440